MSNDDKSEEYTCIRLNRHTAKFFFSCVGAEKRLKVLISRAVVETDSSETKTETAKFFRDQDQSRSQFWLRDRDRQSSRPRPRPKK